MTELRMIKLILLRDLMSKDSFKGLPLNKDKILSEYLTLMEEFIEPYVEKTPDVTQE